VPTTGLPATDAKDYAALLEFAATLGQTEGFGLGQLPPGYLPMTAANGLGALANYTVAAAADVAAQNGQVPPLTPVASSGSTAPATTAKASSAFPPVAATSGSHGGSSGSVSGTGPTGSTDSGGTGSSTNPSHPGHKTAVLPLGGAISKAMRLGSALAIALWTGGVLILLVLGLGLFGALGVPLTYLVGRRRGKW
jgi:hypothetical protein